MDQELEIIEGLKSGRDEAYEYLYKHHYKVLCAIAYEYTTDALVSEMVVSDVIFSIWQNRVSLEIRSSLRNYLVKSVRNRSLNYLMQTEKQHALRQQVGQHINKEHIDFENSPDNPLMQLIDRELDARINDCIGMLPEQTRQIFCLSRFDGMKYEEIAQELSISVDVVKYHIKSAIVKLRAGLQEYLLFLLFIFLSMIEK